MSIDVNRVSCKISLILLFIGLFGTTSDSALDPFLLCAKGLFQLCAQLTPLLKLINQKINLKEPGAQLRCASFLFPSLNSASFDTVIIYSQIL